MSSQQPSCELWMPCRKSEQRLCKRVLVPLHIGPNTPQTRKTLNSAPHHRSRRFCARTLHALWGMVIVGNRLRRDAP